MSAAQHTPGPWRLGKVNGVVADHPVPGIGGSDEVEYYGGHLVCESVTPKNARLIAAAPDLLRACIAALATHGLTTVEPNLPSPSEVEGLLRAAIAKARGQ